MPNGSVGRKVGNLMRIMTGDWTDWYKLRETRNAEWPWAQRSEWLAQRREELAPRMKSQSGDSSGNWILAYERAELELYCKTKEWLPTRGLNVEKMRWLGFKVEAPSFGSSDNIRQDRLHGRYGVSAIFPEGWDMHPALPDDDPTGATFAVITDPEGQPRFDVMYKNAPYETIAYIYDTTPGSPQTQAHATAPAEN